MYNPYDQTIPIINPIVLAMLLVSIITIGYLIYAFSSFSSTSSFSSSLINMDALDNTSGQSNMVIILAIILIIFIIINALHYFLNVNVTAYVQGLFSPKTDVDIVVTKPQGGYKPAPVPEIKFKKQVFNIPGNYYDYSNAKALCAAYGAELATYDQIEQAYESGAEWCNYGWSANQLALFPTQKASYDKLQSTPGHENDCGRTGVNGGFIANPNVRFGVNCYGNKPKITGEEEELMKTANPYPESAQDIAFQKKVDAFKQSLSQILVSPFNYNTWGSI